MIIEGVSINLMWQSLISFYQRIAAKRMFSRWAESYEFDVMENHYSAVDRVAQAAIQYNQNFKDRPYIADIGIGTGLLAQQLQDALACRIIGLDFTDDMMAICAQKDVAELLIKCDVGRDVWPIEHESMDMVVSAGLLEYLTPAMADHFLKESHRTLQKNGILIYTYMPCEDDGKATQLWHGHSGTFVICAYTKNEMEQMIKQNNLEVLEHSNPFKGSIYEDGSSYDYRLIVSKKN